jgi:hypothetical protein
LVFLGQPRVAGGNNARIGVTRRVSRESVVGNNHSG